MCAYCAEGKALSLLLTTGWREGIGLRRVAREACSRTEHVQSLRPPDLVDTSYAYCKNGFLCAAMKITKETAESIALHTVYKTLR